jgi:hypothetical protein
MRTNLEVIFNIELIRLIHLDHREYSDLSDNERYSYRDKVLFNLIKNNSITIKEEEYLRHIEEIFKNEIKRYVRFDKRDYSDITDQERYVYRDTAIVNLLENNSITTKEAEYLIQIY